MLVNKIKDKTLNEQGNEVNKVKEVIGNLRDNEINEENGSYIDRFAFQF